MEKETESNSKKLTCSVRNCGALIDPGKEIRIGDKIYCQICGVAIVKSSLPVFEI